MTFTARDVLVMPKWSRLARLDASALSLSLSLSPLTLLMMKPFTYRILCILLHFAPLASRLNKEDVSMAGLAHTLRMATS